MQVSVLELIIKQMCIRVLMVGLNGQRVTKFMQSLSL